MSWSLYSGENYLKPKIFSNGKSQEDIVNEILSSIKQGNKVIFLHGICGTGKSAIALNLARKLGKTSVVVPIKNLQEQYKRDYGGEGSKHVLKEKILENIDGEKFPELAKLKNQKEKLKISVITGRANHKCKFLEDNSKAIPKIKREVDSKLHDIFEGKKEEVEELIAKDISAENLNIPCKIEFKDRNWQKIKKYISQNPKVTLKDFDSVKDVRRFSIAPVCPHWAPVISEKYDLDLDNSKKRTYEGINGEKIVFYDRGKCPFYQQFKSYVDSDVIVFNSQKYKCEFELGRKPKTEVEIIDECDEFLDSFANSKNLNLGKLQTALVYLVNISSDAYEVVEKLMKITNSILSDERINSSANNEEIIPLKDTELYDLFKLYTDNSWFVEEIDEENYAFEVNEIVRTFDEFLNETYLTVNKKDKNLIINLVTTNLEKKFSEIVEKNKILVLMSGTIHSEQVLRNIFGLKEYKIVEAETEQQGRIEVHRTGKERDCKYSNFSNGACSRKEYLDALGKCVEGAKKPCLVHVNAFNDLPSLYEIDELNLKNLISREELRDTQKNDKDGKDVREFKRGERDVLFSTKVSRGVDFPGNQCNSIVFTKYPNPNVKDAFWKILYKTHQQYYWKFYKDKANRELWQKVYRGLRFSEDHVYVLSPDSRVLDVFEK